MKKYLIPLFLIFFVACSTHKQDGYKISGEITGEIPEELVFLKTQKDNKEVTLDSSKFVDGKFLFSGKVELPEMYYITIGNQNPIPLFVENTLITIKANIDSLSKAEIVGSKINDKYLAYQTASLVFNAEMMKIYNQMKSTEDENLINDFNSKLDSLYEAKISFTKAYVKDNGNSVIAPFLISKRLIYSLELKELEELTNIIAPEIKNSVYTKTLIERIELLRKLQAGMPAPEFTQNNTVGKPVSLTDFRGKYLLIDFWASWCGPCRRANPTVVKVYKKYSKKNFTVLGISMDDNKENWLKAIEDDGLIWEQVSTLEGWKNPVGKLYGVNSIPHAILIDPDGKIVKRGVHAEELDEILKDLLK